MDVALFVAQVYGLICVLVGLGLLFNGAHYKKAFDEMLGSAAGILYGGIAALFVGFLIVTHHNVWEQDWTVLVTLVGWLALIKGVLLLLAPKFLVDFSKPMMKNMNGLGFGVLILGLVFCYFGYFV